MRNLPLVLDTKLQFAEWFKKISWLVYGCVYMIALHDFEHSCNESYSKRVDDPRMERRPPYLWKWMDDSDILSSGMRVSLRDSDIKRFLFECSRYRYERF